MKVRNFLHLTIATLTLPLTFAHAGTFSATPFTGDQDSGVNAGLNYTATVDFNGDGTRVINAVPFTSTGVSGINYDLSGAPDAFNGNIQNVTGGSGLALRDFYFTGDSSGNATLTLNNLTVGQNYTTSWYNAAFGGGNQRVVGISASGTGDTINFNQDYTGGGNGNILRYNFTATASTISYSFDAVVNGDAFHHYAFSNAVTNSALLSTPTVTSASGPGPFTPFAVSNNDLLQTNLGSVTSSDTGLLTREGATGVPALTNGSFTIVGGNPTDNSGFATVGDGAFIEFNLDTSVNAFGYDISSIQAFGGWNDAGRDRQLFKLLYSLVGSTDFTYLGAVDSDPAPGGNPSGVRSIFDTALTGVDGIRLEYFGGQENGYAGLGEVDVIGVASVPEPATASFLLLGSAFLLRRRRN